jgi:hypothetical protein
MERSQIHVVLATNSVAGFLNFWRWRSTVRVRRRVNVCARTRSRQHSSPAFLRPSAHIRTMCRSCSRQGCNRRSSGPYPHLSRQGVGSLGGRGNVVALRGPVFSPLISRKRLRFFHRPSWLSMVTLYGPQHDPTQSSIFEGNPSAIPAPVVCLCTH